MNQEEMFRMVLQEFSVETMEQLNEIDEQLLRLEGDFSSREPLSAIFRILHTLKGNAQSIAFNGVSDFAHACEDYLSALRDERVSLNQASVTLFLSATEALRNWVAASVNEQREVDGTEFENLSRRLREASQHEIAGDAPAGPLLESLAVKTSTVRIGIGNLDRLLDLTGEITISRGRMQQLLKEGRLGDAAEAHREADRLFLDLQEQVMRMRMIPVAPLFRHFNRVVRDLALETKKSVVFYADGEDVELDARALELLRGPLTHLIRNAIDHGIERADERAKHRKSPEGRLKIRAIHDTGGIVIEVEDDGRGFDLDAIRAKAHALKLIDEDAAPSDDELLQFVFLPGFSTTQEITSLSGRGVGMDAVKAAVESLRGSLHIESVAGSGSKCVIRLPLTLAILDCFAVEAGAETYLIALDALVECNDFSETETHEGTAVVPYRNGPLPCIRLTELFGLQVTPSPRQSVVVIRWKNQEFGLVVDRLLGNVQAVVKPLGALLQGLACLTGTTILGSGKVAFILDLSSIWRSAIQKYNHQFSETNAVSSSS